MVTELFPRTLSEAVAFLYLQNQDLKGKSPSEIYEMYITALAEISGNISKNQKEGGK